MDQGRFDLSKSIRIISGWPKNLLLRLYSKGPQERHGQKACDKIIKIWEKCCTCYYCRAATGPGGEAPACWAGGSRAPGGGSLAPAGGSKAPASSRLLGHLKKVNLVRHEQNRNTLLVAVFALGALQHSCTCLSACNKSLPYSAILSVYCSALCLWLQSWRGGHWPRCCLQTH